MNILGIIVEYNPFHNGHLHHLKEAKKATGADYVVAVMSGNFLQRGLPACLDKFTRAKLALLHGVDIVIELPVLFATSAANTFAHGAVSLLNDFGATHICFGAETPDINMLRTVAKENSAVSERVQQGLATGMSYPRALDCAIDNQVFTPNNILGIEYLRAIDALGSNIQPIAIQRNTTLKSATSINQQIISSSLHEVCDNVPTATLQELQKVAPISLDNFSHIFQYKVAKEKKELAKYLDVDEGLENRIISKTAEAYNLTELLALIKTKRYTMTKLQRMATHILLDITKEDMLKIPTPPYVKILGMRREAQHLLNSVKAVPLIVNIKSDMTKLSTTGYDLLQKEIFATDLYHLGIHGHKNSPAPKGLEYTTPLLKI